MNVGLTIEQQNILMLTLPAYLKNDIIALQKGIKNNSSVLDCLYNEVQGSINSAFHGKEITREQAEYLWEQYSGLEC